MRKRSHATSLSRNYVPDWGVNEALRELFQNAIDHGDWRCYLAEGQLIIVSKNADLQPATLLLGQSNKPEGSIGKFGEGYKLAALVLVREGLKLTIVRPRFWGQWTARLSKSKVYDTERLVFDEWPHEWESDDLMFVLSGLTDEHIAELLRTNLHLTPHETLFEHQDIRVLADRPGQVYVRGLWVTEVKDLKFGYDFSPSVLSLDRDRRMVKEFDVYWATSNAWLSSGRAELSDLVLQDVPDVKYLASNLSWSSSHAAERVAEAFVETHSKEAVAVSTQGDLETALSHGHEKVVLVSDNVCRVLQYSTTYRPPPPPKLRLTPYDRLRAFYDEHKGALEDAELEIVFLELLDASKDWRDLS